MDKEQIKIKKGNLNYDQSGRAYPDNPELKENWDCIWEHDDKYYELVGDNEHKEWEEVKIYDRIILDSYKNYLSTNEDFEWTDDFCKKNLKDYGDQWDIFSKEEFINKCKTDNEFSENWGLKVEERELSINERESYFRNNMGMKDIQFMLYSLDGEEGLHKEYDKQNVPRITITIIYNNEKIEIYE